MTKPQLIDLIKLLSALESWSFANNQRLPDYLLERIDTSMERLEAEVLK
jgi:hypothetical protein